MVKKNRNESSDDEFSSVTPIISNSGGRKANPARGTEDDVSAVSTATPIISNKSPDQSTHSQQSKSNEIDYGQLVVDSRTRDRKMPSGGNPAMDRIQSGTQGSTRSSQSRSNNSRVKTNRTSQASTDIESGENTIDQKSINSSLNAQPSNHCEPLINEADQVNADDQREIARSSAFETMWLPFFVATMSTARFVLSTTSALGCNFVEIDIGFVPKNIQFNASKVKIGPWAYERGKCLSYPENFVKMFIEGEKSWKASRVASIVNISLGFVVFIMASFVITYKVLRLWPTSARVTYCIKGFDKRWEMFTFVSVLLMFIFEVIKFSLWGVNLCTDEVWMNDKYAFVPATECTLSTGARCSLSAIVFDLIIVILLTAGSRNLRRSLSQACCFFERCKGKRDQVRTDDEEIQGPRYFFEGQNNAGAQGDDENVKTTDDDTGTFFKRRKSKVTGAGECNNEVDGPTKEDSSLLPQSDQSTCMEQAEKMNDNSSLQNISSDPSSDSDSSDSEDSGATSLKNDSRPVATGFEDDTADLLGSAMLL